MVVEVLDPSTAPLWLNVIIWMGVFWQYILVSFIPGFYIAITWLFGFPLLQRWQQEVVIMLYPTKVKFGKITQQYEPYFRSKKGVYWLSNPLQPVEHRVIPDKTQKRMDLIRKQYEELMQVNSAKKVQWFIDMLEKLQQAEIGDQDRLEKIKVSFQERLNIEPEEISYFKEKYEVLASKNHQKESFNKKYEALQHTTKEEKIVKKLLKEQAKLAKKVLLVNPINQIHVYTHAVNQSIYNMTRRESKVDEILNNDAKPKKMSGHNIWIMQHPKLHFHRHYQLIIDHTGMLYTLVPVKERQQFSIGFWHSLGIILQKEVEVEETTEVSVGGGSGRQLMQTAVTTNVVLQQMKEVQDYQNFSATRAYMLLKRRSKLEDNFMYWITGSINPIIFIVLIGAIAAIAMIIFFTYGNSPSETMGPPPT